MSKRSINGCSSDPGAHRDAERIEGLPPRRAVDALQHEGHDGIAAFAGWPVPGSACRRSSATRPSPLDQRLSLRVRCAPVESADPFAGRRPGRSPADRPRAGLETRGGGAQVVLGQGDAADHRAAAIGTAAWPRAIPAWPTARRRRWAIGLVAGKGVEIDAERGQVERPVRRALGTVEHPPWRDRLGQGDDGPDMSRSAPVTLRHGRARSACARRQQGAAMHPRSMRPSTVTGIMSSSMPVRDRSSCTARCRMVFELGQRMRSPLQQRAVEYATRLIAAVQPPVNRLPAVPRRERRHLDPGILVGLGRPFGQAMHARSTLARPVVS